MNIREITPCMDGEAQNVMHSMNAMEYFRAGDMAAAAIEVSLDRGFCGTFAEWECWAKKADVEWRQAEHNAHRSFWDMA